MAEADDHEVVKSVQEFYADYLAITKDLFCLSYGREVGSIYGIERDSWSAEGLEKATEGIVSVLLSLKKKPLIRYERNSAMAKKLGTEIQVLPNHSLPPAFEDRCLLLVSIKHREPTLRLPQNRYSTHPPHPRPSQRPHNSPPIAMDLPSHGARTPNYQQRARLPLLCPRHPS